MTNLKRFPGRVFVWLRVLLVVAIAAQCAVAKSQELAAVRGELVGRTDKSQGDDEGEDKGNIYGAMFSPDGRLLSARTGHGTYLWDLEGRRERVKLEGTRSSSGIAFSLDSHILYQWGFARRALTFDGLFTSTSPLTLSEISVATGKRLKSQEFPYPPKNASPGATTAIFSPAHGELLISFAISRDIPRNLRYKHVVIRHDVANDKMIGKPIESDAPISLLPLGRKLYGIIGELAPDEKTISYSVWDLEKNAPAVSLGDVEFQDGIFGFSVLSPCRKFFMVHTEHSDELREEWGRYQIWAVDTGEKVADFTVQREDIE